MARTNRVWHRSTRRVGAAGVALALLAGACGGDTSGGEPAAAGREEPLTTTEAIVDESPVTGGDLVVGLETELNSLLPGEGEFGGSSRNVPFAIYDPLIVTDGDGAFKAYLAESFHANPELTEWTITLRPDVTFHDGTPLDAATLKAIFDEYLNVPDANTAGSLTNVTELRVDDDRTVTYVLASPDAAFLDVLRGPAGWPFSVTAARAAGDAAGTAPAGTGPFRLAEWTPDDRTVVVRNTSYWRQGLPYLDSITFRPIPDEETRVSALLSGTTDVMQSRRGATIKQVIELAEQEQLETHTYAGDDAGVAIMNVRRPPFDDLRIRLAAAHMYDPYAVAEVLGDDGLVEASTQFFSEDSPWYSERVAAARPAYDPARARRLVEEYQNDPARSDGKPVGAPVTAGFLCLEDPLLVQIGLLTQQLAAAVGLEIEVESVGPGELVSRMTGDAAGEPPFEGDFDSACFRVQHSGDPATTFANAFGAPETTATNYTNFTSPELLELIDQLRVTGPVEERQQLVEEIGVIINEAVPFTIATGTPAMMAVREGVQNIDGWTTPEGAEGDGMPFADVRWGEVWKRS